MRPTRTPDPGVKLKRATDEVSRAKRLLSDISPADASRIIEMAWEDRTPFEAINIQFGLSEPQVIAFMRQSLKSSSFRLWRTRVTGRVTKHLKRRPQEMNDGRRHTATLAQPSSRR